MEQEIMEDAIWITWERQIRNQSTSQYFGVPLFEIIRPTSSRTGRYLSCAKQTISIIFRQKPRILFAQNPSIVLAILAVVLGKLIRCKVVIDAHNTGIHGPENGPNFISRANRYVIRKSDAVIVTNAELAEYVQSLGGQPIILPDPLPRLSPPDDLNTPSEPTDSQKLKALCITSWSDDEPLSELLIAAKRLPDNVDFYFSGNFKRFLNSIPMELPENVKLMGFVEEAAFQRQLFASDFCIDLTKRAACMVCGAYESISAEKPILLSNFAAQRNYFTKGTVFCDNSVEGIMAGIQELIDKIDEYKKEASELKQEILTKEEQQRAQVFSEIHSL
ncbi:glycosyltransferase [Marinobacter sp. F4216]|uniref:glycosyltransferase n=1 Tax=Marinobacter sp. F4216 TaxID=2874281 RepID=UPI001CBEFF79|nr:glycosyltransferase [Marinobacter sp. F4216]MBZ2167854.1 hypothetical protein [Marinobacter sp. F4216]